MSSSTDVKAWGLCMVLFVPALLVCVEAMGRTIYVDTEGAADYSNIQAAVDNADDGDTIVISPGTYAGPGNCDIVIDQEALTIRSVDPLDPAGVAATVIDCNGTSEEYHGGFLLSLYSDNTDRVLDGLTIINGYRANGGAIYGNGGYTISNCVLANNHAKVDGGAICGPYGNTAVVISNCTLKDNVAKSGAGIDAGNVVMLNCTVSGNVSEEGGGGLRVSEITMQDCVVSENSTTQYDWYGGGLLCADGTVTRCVFSNNSCSESGAGIANSMLGTLRIEDSVLMGNRAGALSVYGTVEADNCVFAQNTGPTIFIDNGGEFKATNCTIADNATAHYELIMVNYDGTGSAENCIFWNNLVVDPYRDPIDELFLFRHSCVQNLPGRLDSPEFGNIDSDPCFAATSQYNDNGTADDVSDDTWTGGDYHLKSVAGRWNPQTCQWDTDDAQSPCIDAGDPETNWGPETWPNGARANMGAYGRTGQASMSILDAGCISDLNADGFTDNEDIVEFSRLWLSSLVPIRQDMNHDGTVDAADFAIFSKGFGLSRWKVFPPKAHDPFPSDGATSVDFNVQFTWSDDPGVTSYSIYFGPSASPPQVGVSTEATFNPGPLSNKTVYYWRIDQTNDAGTTVGDVWSFTTPLR